jgi:hypothetical protein
MASIDDLYDAVRKRQCILFVGAGVHYPPPDDLQAYKYPEADRPPLGSQLSCDLSLECRRAQYQPPLTPAEVRYLVINKRNLQRTSWFYEERNGRARLIDRVIASVQTNKRPSAVVRALAAIGFPLIITTNYDQLLDTSLSIAHGQQPNVSIYDPEGLTPTKGYLIPEPRVLAADPNVNEPVTQPWLFKMHGCVSDRKTIVITDEDYIRFVMRMGDTQNFHPVHQRIRVKFTEWPTLFIGYSLLDYNLRLLFRTLRWRIDQSELRSSYSVDLYPDPLVKIRYEDRDGYVRFFVENIWKFVPELYQQVFGRKMPP